MTNQQPPRGDRGDSNRQPQSLPSKLWNYVKQPKTQIAAVATVGTIAVGTYIGGKFVITRVIPPRIEEELEKVLGRDVELGEIKIDALNRITVDGVTIPPTAEDQSNITIDDVEIDANLCSLLGKQKLFLDVTAKDITGYAQLDTLLPPSDEKKPLPDSFLLPAQPITTDVTLRLENVNLQVTPTESIEPIDVKTEGEIELLYDDQKQPLKYNLKNTIGDNNVIRVEGQTLLSNTQSETIVKIDNLDLPQVTHLVPQIPAEIEQGAVSGKLDIKLPSIPKWQEPPVKVICLLTI